MGSGFVQGSEDMGFPWRAGPQVQELRVGTIPLLGSSQLGVPSPCTESCFVSLDVLSRVAHETQLASW